MFTYFYIQYPHTFTIKVLICRGHTESYKQHKNWFLWEYDTWIERGNLLWSPSHSYSASMFKPDIEGLEQGVCLQVLR